MIGKSNEKKADIKPRDDGVELENQFIIRLPEEPAAALRDAIREGTLKDRMTIKLDNDLRYGEVRIDHWLLYAKVVDLPTIVECLKTIDNKSFYKSSDICQIMICKEELEEEPEKESPNKGKKKDPNKVDKKYLWPHGITPPCKNVRKRRFRKTLKKKNVEAPEIEKEVKHLLRIDNEAVKVEYEIINEDLDKLGMDNSDIKDYNEGDEDFNNDTLNNSDKLMDLDNVQRDLNVESDDDDDKTAAFSQNNAQIGTVAEHDIFGEELSSSDDDDDNEPRLSQPIRDVEESSRLSADDSRMSDFFGVRASTSGNVTKANEFNKAMFGDSASSPKSNIDKYGGSNSNLAAPSGFFDSQSQSSQMQTKREDIYDDDTSTSQPQLTNQQISAKISQLSRQIAELKSQQSQKSQEIASIQNATLKNRMQEALDNVLSMLVEKELELKDYETMLDSQLN